MEQRINKIAQCVSEIERMLATQRHVLIDMVGEMDWRTELHYLIWEWED